MLGSYKQIFKWREDQVVEERGLREVVARAFCYRITPRPIQIPNVRAIMLGSFFMSVRALQMPLGSVGVSFLIRAQ